MMLSYDRYTHKPMDMPYISFNCLYESVVVVIDSGGDRLNVLVGNQFCGGDLPPCKSRH